MQHVNPLHLTDGALEYAFLESCGMPVFGATDGPFVMRDSTNNSFMMFRGDNQNIEQATFTDPLSLFPFTVALKFSAKFSVEDGVVTCLIGDAISTGLTYSQAAMRAVVIHNRMQERKKSGV